MRFFSHDMMCWTWAINADTKLGLQLGYERRHRAFSGRFAEGEHAEELSPVASGSEDVRDELAGAPRSEPGYGKAAGTPQWGLQLIRPRGASC